jgi:hypothetical protein
MSKRTIIILLTLGVALLFALAVWQTAVNWAWLDAHYLAGLVVLNLIMLGVLIFVVPMYVKNLADTMTPWEIVRAVLVRVGLALLAFVAVVIILILIFALARLPALLGRPALVLPWLSLLVPFAVTLIDLYKGSCARTLPNFFIVFGLYLFRIYGMFAILLIFIPLVFALFPAGFFLQFFSLVDLAARQFGYFIGERPLLCEWGNIPWPVCGPALFGFHIGHLLLVVAAVKYGYTLFDAATGWYRAGLAGLAARVEK